MGYVYILGTVLFTVYGQLVLKWRMNIFGPLPDEIVKKLIFIFNALLDPYILSGFAAAFVASLFWVAAVTKFELSFAYPFTSLSFVLVVILSSVLFEEQLTLNKVIGMSFILLGIFFTSRSM